MKKYAQTYCIRILGAVFFTQFFSHRDADSKSVAELDFLDGNDVKPRDAFITLGMRKAKNTY